MPELSYEHIGLIPRILSTVEHRSDCDTSIDFLGYKLTVPMISSPMDTTTNGEMAYKLADLGALGIIHRFQSIEEQINQYTEFGKRNKWSAGCAIGVVGDYQERFMELYHNGCRLFCLDTANGFNIQVASALCWIGSKNDSTIKLIVGNIASEEGYKYLFQKLNYNGFGRNNSAVRIGIAGGSVCVTRTETGVYYPMVSSISECHGARVGSSSYDDWPLIIADGGISKPCDLAKALAIGADVVMCGSIFSGTRESPGNVINNAGSLMKVYRGAASFGTQKDFNGKTPNYIEGTEMLVPYKGTVENVITRFKNGLQSSMSYFNARTLDEFRDNVTWKEIR